MKTLRPQSPQEHIEVLYRRMEALEAGKDESTCAPPSPGVVEAAEALLEKATMGLAFGDVLIKVQEYQTLRAALDAHKANNGWLPMDSAPKDGTEILISDSDGITIIAHWVCRAGIGGWKLSWNNDPWDLEAEDSWHPLPPTPDEGWDEG